MINWCIPLIFKLSIFVIIFDLSHARFQSQFWISNQDQNLNELKSDTTCPCCKFQFEQCGTETILAINQCSLTNYNQIVFKTIRLEPHYQIILTFNFWRIDYWNYDDFYVYLDYHKMYSSQFSHTTSNQNICGSSVYNDEIFPMSITIPHTIPAITVIFGVKKGIWGISQMILEAKLCPEDCQSCSENQCFDQYLYFFTLNWENVVNSSEGWLTNNVIQTSVITYLQARYLETYGNHLINEIKLNHHQAISLQVKVLVYNSNPTQINIAIDDIIVSTIQYTGGWINYPNGFGYRSIKIFNIHQYPHIHSQAKITISLILSKNNPSLLLFFAIRDFQLFLKSSLFEFICKDDNLVPFDGCFSQMFDCIEGCSNCIRGTCLDCKTGWEYNELEKICIPICGDSLITHFEECDDGNNVPYDGCHLCKYSCAHNCKTCQFGNCLECNVNYSLSLNKKQCLPFCDDTINFFFEIFDDQTQIDRNLKCQKSCQLECKLCINNTCYQCNDGWQLQNNQCHQICGDGLIAINSIELCDDGNFNEIDGCYQCLFECIPYCFFCSDKNTCLQCQEFFTLVDNSCIPICGDGIVINSLEDCEDGNDLPYDGCYQCKLSCIQNCEVCQLGGCEKCNLGYQINDNFCEKVVEEEIQNQDCNDEFKSIEFCGDGIIQNNESCDDFNSINLDGCSSTCKVENQWNCKSIDNTSYCYPQTLYKLFYLNNTQSIEYVQLSFTNKLIFNNIIENYTKEITYKIDNLSSNQYELTIFQVSNIEDFDLLDLSFIFQIKFFNSFNFQPILRVSFKDDLIDLNYFPIVNNEQKISLQQPRVLTKSQIQTAFNLKSLSFWMLIALCICGFIMLILGDFKNFTEILDILQFQSNLKFINIPFPQNVEIYFESSNFVSIKPYLKKIYLLDLFDYAFDFHYCESIGKFQYYDINADLLNNIYGLFIQVLLIILIDIFLRYIKYQYYNSHNLLRYLNYISLSESKILKKKAILIFTWTKILIKKPSLISKIFFSSLFLANSWDLLFKILLYIISNKEKTVRSFFSYIISFGYLIFVIFFLIQYFRGQAFNMQLQKIRNKQYEAIVLFKKFIFLMILIGIQNQPITQCIMFTVLLFIYLFFINTVQLIYQKSELFNLIWQEVPVMIFTLLSLAYCNEFYKFLTANQYFILGFIQIGLLMIGLMGPLVRCSIKFYNKVQAYCQKKQTQELNLMQQSANPNILTEIKY